jgi:hypothetical protein
LISSAGRPPGSTEALWPFPGSLMALIASYMYVTRRERLDDAMG